MNFCTKCGNKFEKENAFCSKCGFKLDAKNESILGLKTAKETSAKPQEGKGDFFDGNQKQKEVVQTSKIQNILNYVITRKRNILIFILLTLVLKPLIHYTFFEKQEEFINYDRELLFGSKNADTYIKDSLGNLIYIGLPFEDARAKFWNASRNYINIYTKKGEQVITEKGATGGGEYGTYTNHYFYPKEIKRVSFFKTLNAIFIDKNWIFFISFGSLLLFVFLMNDKIKAR
jgi:predicted nucleic acid-binding Zn ribbon protein